jgi:hypothetical protein
MYGEEFVKLRDNIDAQLVDTVEHLKVIEDTGIIPNPMFYNKLAVLCFLKDEVTIMNDVCIDFNKSVKLLYNKVVN